MKDNILDSLSKGRAGGWCRWMGGMCQLIMRVVVEFPALNRGPYSLSIRYPNPGMLQFQGQSQEAMNFDSSCEIIFSRAMPLSVSLCHEYPYITPWAHGARQKICIYSLALKYRNHKNAIAPVFTPLTPYHGTLRVAGPRSHRMNKTALIIENARVRPDQLLWACIEVRSLTETRSSHFQALRPAHGSPGFWDCCCCCCC